jgi:hypothetical protein
VKWIVLAATVETAVTGLVLLAAPSLFAWLILHTELSEPGQVLGRIAGIAMLGLALACWPAPATAQPASGIHALLIYNLLATAYLLYLGVGGSLVGILLWPAVMLHALLALLFTGQWLAANRR